MNSLGTGIDASQLTREEILALSDREVEGDIGLRILRNHYRAEDEGALPDLNAIADELKRAKHLKI